LSNDQVWDTFELEQLTPD